MKSFSTIFEGKESTAQAKALGLAYAGGGYWQDPKTGQLSYETDKSGNLVPYKGGGGDNPMAKMGPSPLGNELAVPQQTALQGLMSKGMQPGAGVGPAGEAGDEVAPSDSEDPEEAKAPSGFNQGQGWDPGPNGDTCVNGEEPKPQGIPLDTFVRRGQNDTKWTSGPDGSNFFNTNFAEWMDAAPGEFLPEGVATDLSKIGAKMMGSPGTTPPSTASEFPRKIGRTIGSNMKPAVQQKDQAKVDLLNQDAKPFLKDPNFDMTMGKELGSGAFGKVGLSKSDPNVVVKEGEIGPNELKALWTMRNNPNFPSLINAQFDTPFLHQSSGYNNPGDEPLLRGDGGNYFDPDDQDSFDFEKKYPTAKGKFAMSKMQGRELDEAFYDMDGDRQQGVLRKIWNLRKAMHMQGISHNDMHGGNIFVDDDDNVNMLDLGLANADPLSALMEGLGGVSMEDYQLARDAGIGNVPEDLRERLQNNVGGVREMLLDNLDIDMDDDDSFMENVDNVEQLMKGGIRHRGSDLEDMKKRFPALGDGKLVMKMIQKLYDGVGDNDLQQRMSAAVDRARPDTQWIQKANDLRKRRGEPSLSIRNPNVIPPRNLDPDD